MYEHNTGIFFNGNVPFEERSTYLRETGYSKARPLAQWEKDLVENDIIKQKIKYYQKLHERT